MTDAHGPHAPASAAAVRSSALALLASGNSLDSVAHVLGIPVDTLRSWATQPAAAPSVAGPIAAEPAHAWLSFPTTTAYALGPMGRGVMIALALFVAGAPLLGWILAAATGSATSTFTACALLAVPCLGLAACAILYATRARFELRPHSIARIVLSKPQVLAYSEIVGLTATRQGKSASYAVVLHARAGTPSLTINPEDAHLRDPALLAWLDSIPRQGGIPIERRSDDASGSGGLSLVLSWGAGAFAALMLLMLSSMPIDTARALLFGYPALEQLSVAEGTLVDVTNCRGGGRSPSYVVVTLQTRTGDQHETLSCIVDRSALARPLPRHLVIYRDPRPFASAAVRQVEFDGKVLQDYADYVALSRRTDPALLAWQLLMIAMVASLFYGFYRSRRGDD